jgi:16S rRNA (adenine1518-N6/adenine1519-N6)-dimethyltransferase
MNKKPQMYQARKRFGQNFLHDHGVIARIVRSINPKPEETLVEIGPGLGALTELLLQAGGGQLNVVELDRDLVPILRTKFFNYPGLRIHEADALRFDFSRLAEPGKPLRIVGNLPYNISTPLMFQLLRHASLIKDMHFMLQKEVVDRLAAGPGDSAYGRLGIMMQYHCAVAPLFVVGPGAFQPAPKVDSAIVRLVPHATPPYPVEDMDLLERVVREAFNMRRKTLRNALGNLITDPALWERMAVDSSKRPENLSLEDYVRITNVLTAAQTEGAG